MQTHVRISCYAAARLTMVVTSQPEERKPPRMAGVVTKFLAAVLVTASRDHSHAFPVPLWNLIPLALAMACLVYVLFKPTNTSMLFSAAVSASTLVYALVI
jgi:hypothetical protein